MVTEAVGSGLAEAEEVVLCEALAVSEAAALLEAEPVAEVHRVAVGVCECTVTVASTEVEWVLDAAGLEEADGAPLKVGLLRAVGAPLSECEPVEVAHSVAVAVGE